MIFLLKLTFTTGLIYWLISSGKLKFDYFIEVAMNPWVIVLAFFMLFGQFLVCTKRWMILLQTEQDVNISFSNALKLNWIGLAFSTILPGAVTGDVIKAIYVKKDSPNLSKSFILTSVFLDRIMGLSGLLFLMGTFSIVKYNSIISKAPNFKAFLFMNGLLFAGTIVFLMTLFFPKKIQEKFIDLASKLPTIGGLAKKALEKFWILGGKPKAIINCFAMSVLSQLIAVLAFWVLIGSFVSAKVGMGDFLTFVPIGFISNAIPISPGGAGIGHAIFDTLFNLFNIENGASLYNVFFIVWVGLNLIGFIPYLMSGIKKPLKKAIE